MKTIKLFAFTLTLASLTSACGKHSDTPAYTPTDFDMTVEASAFDSTPGKFSSLYKGACIVVTKDAAYSNCKTTVRVIQANGRITIRTSFALTGSGDPASNLKLSGHSEDNLSIDGRDLIMNHNDIGQIGAHGFKYQRQGDTYYFARLYPDHYKYEGNFALDTIDGSQQVVHVLGAVQRGSANAAQSRNSRRVSH